MRQGFVDLFPRRTGAYGRGMLSLAAALILDALLGEPRWLWARVPHPVVLIGRGIGWMDRVFNHGENRRLKGVGCGLALVVLAAGVGLAIAALPLGWLWEIGVAAIFLAHRSLVDHVQAVAVGLRAGLAEGRSAVAMIVGRDTAAMDAPAVARAAIESAGENFSDGVIAPAFWFALLGLPGILIYKAVNTADSMIGYRTERHADFGWAAARLDDVLNWVPARLTAMLIALVHARPEAWSLARIEGPRHRSPNAGWPEAALARVLDVAVSGPRSYGGQIEDHPFVHANGRKDIGAAEVAAACAALWRSWGGFLAIALTLGLASLALN